MQSGRSERFEVIGHCINSDKKSVSVLDCNLRFVNCNDILDIQNLTSWLVLEQLEDGILVALGTHLTTLHIHLDYKPKYPLCTVGVISFFTS
jgi:hypothetical protein